MTTAREKWLDESRKRLREVWGLTKDQTDIAVAMMQDAMAVADATRQEDGAGDGDVGLNTTPNHSLTQQASDAPAPTVTLAQEHFELLTAMEAIRHIVEEFGSLENVVTKVRQLTAPPPVREGGAGEEKP